MPRILALLTLTGTPHPQAEIQSLSVADGVFTFAWLAADGERVDSGGSIGRFTPSWQLAAETGERIYHEPTDAELAEAIANPPAQIPAVPSVVTRRQLFLWLNSINITRAMLRAQLAGNEAALIEVEEASEFLRSNPLVNQLAAALGIDADTAFREASQL